MKSYGKLWEKITDEENFLAAWRAFRKNHGAMPAVKKFARQLELNLDRIRASVASGTWEPSDYHQFRIYEPKPRTISSVPVRDRIVHHALCNVITPFMERRFIDQSYACRKGRGSHMACRRARQLSASHPYFLKIDIRKYFDNIDHCMLVGILSKMFRERNVIELSKKIIFKSIPNQIEGKGVPIGNLTSQWFANLYLDGFDHYCMDALGLGLRFMRYMDDMLLFTDSKEEAWELLYRMREWLWSERRLALKDEATIVAPVTEGIPFLGLKIRPDGWRLKPSRFRRTQRSMRRHYIAYRRGECGIENLQEVLRSMEGSARFFGFKGIYRRVDRAFVDEDGNFAFAEGERVKNRDSGVAASPVFSVNRGGNYNNGANNCSSAGRNTNNVPGNVNDNIGARLASVSGATYLKGNDTFRVVRRPHPEKPALGGTAETNMHLAAAGAVREALGLCFPPSHRSRFSLSQELHKTK